MTLCLVVTSWIVTVYVLCEFCILYLSVSSWWRWWWWWRWQTRIVAVYRRRGRRLRGLRTENVLHSRRNLHRKHLPTGRHGKMLTMQALRLGAFTHVHVDHRPISSLRSKVLRHSYFTAVTRPLRHRRLDVGIEEQYDVHKGAVSWRCSLSHAPRALSSY